MKQHLSRQNFFIAVIPSLILALILFFFSYRLGKDELFLLLNNDEGPIADSVFSMLTFGGDGIMWLPLLLILLFVIKRKDAFMLVLSAFIISTIFIQGIKNFVLPGEPRPTKAIADLSSIHTVLGVDVHSIGSFPSGHTGTAFCIYFLFCLLIPGRWWIVVGFLYAAGVGYSRVYLAQHFPVDVAAGIIVAIISVWLSILVQQKIWSKKTL